MESNKIKKLSLKKETIANLSKLERSRVIGGDDTGVNCYLTPFFWSLCGVEGSCAQPCTGKTLDEGLDPTGPGGGGSDNCGSCQCISVDNMGPCVSN